MSHTPGPWTLDKATGKFGHKTNDIVAPLEGDPHFSQQIVCVMGTDVDDMEANARLIAAAPELLAALKEAHNILTATSLLVKSEQFNSYLRDEFLPRVRAAIAKAEGRS
jgi:hypothetical protein